MFMIRNGELFHDVGNGPLYSVTKWECIGKVVLTVPIGLNDCTSRFYVNLDNDRQFTWLFELRPHELARFGHVCRRGKVKRFEPGQKEPEQLFCKKRKFDTIRLKKNTIGNGEGVSEYSLRSAKIPIEHNREDYSLIEEKEKEKREGQVLARRISAKERRKQLAILDAQAYRKHESELAIREKTERKDREKQGAKVPHAVVSQCASTVQPSVRVKQFVPFLYEHGASVRRLCLQNQPEKRYVLVNRSQLVEVE